MAQQHLSINFTIHLLDEFLITAPSYQLCHGQLSLFTSFCEFVGVPIAPEKTCGPSTVLSFAGIELDTVLFEARLPNDKIEKCVNSIDALIKRKKATLRDIQSIVGLLNFACFVVTPGRPFLRRLIDLTVGVRSPFHKIRLSKEVKADLLVWHSILQNFNGKSFFLDDRWCNSEQLSLFTDSAGSFGFGAIFGSKWCLAC